MPEKKLGLEMQKVENIHLRVQKVENTYTSVRVIHTYPVISCPIGVLFLIHSSP